MAVVAGGAGVIGGPTGVAIPSSTIATFTLGTVIGVVDITVAAIVPDTRHIVLAVPATARAILAMVVRQLILPAIVRLIVLLLQLFLRARAIARMPQVAVRDRAGGGRALCRPMEETVRTRLRAHDPPRIRPAVINVHRPLTLAPRKL